MTKAATRTRKTKYRVKVENAKEVILTGEFTGWVNDRIRLKPDGDGTWSAALELPAGEYEYRLLVDGRWEDDPAATEKRANPFGGMNCVLRIS